MKKLSLIMSVAAIALFGCQNGENAAQNGQNELGVEETRYGEVMDDARNVRTDDDDFIEFSDNDLADRTREGMELDDDYRRIADNQNRNRNGNNNDNNNTRMEVADRAADRIARDMKEVDQAYVLATDDNAYVATVLEDGNDNNQLTDALKRRIAQKVKETDPDINNVYVSANPDFVDLSNDYVNDVQAGEPVEGFFEEFNEMAQRIFPDAQ